jgi:hypothetical protein
MAIELRNLLGQALTCELPATLLFEHPSVHALVDHLLGEHLGAADTDAVSDGERASTASEAGTASETSTASEAGTATTHDLAARLAARLDRLSSGDRS